MCQASPTREDYAPVISSQIQRIWGARMSTWVNAGVVIDNGYSVQKGFDRCNYRYRS